jgi:hypothetical protein
MTAPDVVTVTVTVLFWLFVSAIVTVHEPAALGVTVNVAVAWATAATPVHVSDSENAPEYAGSLAVNVCAAPEPVVINARLFGESTIAPAGVGADEGAVDGALDGAVEGCDDPGAAGDAVGDVPGKNVPLLPVQAASDMLVAKSTGPSTARGYVNIV